MARRLNAGRKVAWAVRVNTVERDYPTGPDASFEVPCLARERNGDLLYIWGPNGYATVGDAKTPFSEALESVLDGIRQTASLDEVTLYLYRGEGDVLLGPSSAPYRTNTASRRPVVRNAAIYDDFEDEDEYRAEMQSLINSGMAWKLEGSIGRAAMSMIESGACILGEEGHKDYWGNYVPSRYEVEPGTKGSVEYAEEQGYTSIEGIMARRVSAGRRVASTWQVEGSGHWTWHDPETGLFWDIFEDQPGKFDLFVTSDVIGDDEDESDVRLVDTFPSLSLAIAQAEVSSQYSSRTAARRTAVQYPEVTVTLSGEDGNAFGILGRVQRALRNAGVPDEEISQFMEEATAGDYDHLLQTVMRWVDWE